MSRGSTQALTAIITAAANTYSFMGAEPLEIAYLFGVTSNLQTQLDGKLTLSGNQTLAGNITCTLNPNNYVLSLIHI